MILVPSHLRQLSGNNFLLILSMLIFLSACSRKIKAPKPPVSTTPVEEAKPREKDLPKEPVEYSIALLLPFELNRINLKTAVKKDLSRADLAIDFYQGMKLALDSLSQSGHNFELHVFDTQNQETRVVNLAVANSIKSGDLIIGPIYPEEAKTFADFADLKDVLQVSPLAASMPAGYKNPRLVMVNNTLEQHGRKIAEFITKDYKPDQVNIVLINTQKTNDARFSTYLKRFINELGADKFRITERPNAIGIEKYLDPVKNNLVLMTSSDRLFIVPAIDRLFKLKNAKYKIELFGHPDWLKANYLVQNKLQTLNTRITSSFYINYKLENVKDFIARYRSEFGSEPSEYAFKGFDIGYYFGGMLVKYGKNYPRHLEEAVYSGLHNNFRFIKEPDNSIKNDELMLLVYRNFELLIQ